MPSLERKISGGNKEKYKELEPGRTNIYAFYDSLSKVLPEGEQILVSVGTSRVAGSQAIYLKKIRDFIPMP